MFTADLLLNAIVAGILLGGFYAAVAIGLAIIFGQLDIVNIAHPAFIIAGAYIVYAFNLEYGLDPVLLGLLAAPIFFVVGVLMYQVYYAAFERTGQEALRGLAFFFGILFITEVTLILVFGVDYRTVSSAYSDITLRLAGLDFPLRLVVPGVQGVSWVKWLRRLEVGDQPWHTREETLHYVDLMPDGRHRQFSSIQECKSVITTPSGGQKLIGRGFYNVSGLAWSGRGRVKRVDVSFDGGRNWRTARLESPVLPKALTRFNIDWVWDVIHLTSDDRTYRMDLDGIRREVDTWFTPAGLEAMLGPATTETERLGREWLTRAGKRWRPFLTVCAYRALRQDPNAVFPTALKRVAIAVECFHKASLIHDDIEDQDVERYGADTLRATMLLAGPIEDDVRRARLIREEIGPDALLMMDANQVWDVDEAIANMARLAEFDPYWIEEPTSPDDVLGHAAIRKRLAPIKVATGEHVHNRVMFKQLLQAGSLDFLQMDAARVAGVNENLAILLLAKKFDELFKKAKENLKIPFLLLLSCLSISPSSIWGQFFLTNGSRYPV